MPCSSRQEQKKERQQRKRVAALLALLGDASAQRTAQHVARWDAPRDDDDGASGGEGGSDDGSRRRGEACCFPDVCLHGADLAARADAALRALAQPRGTTVVSLGRVEVTAGRRRGAPLEVGSRP